MKKCQKKKQQKRQSTTNHYNNHRYRRERFIKRYLNGDGCIIDGFVVDKGHSKGCEVHSITENGVILIHNYYTGRLVTKLIARPEQIKRYYRNNNEEPPKWLIELAEWHKSLNYNK